jgi:hypothetical protein
LYFAPFLSRLAQQQNCRVSSFHEKTKAYDSHIRLSHFTDRTTDASPYCASASGSAFFISGDLVPAFGLHFWRAISKKMECVGRSNDRNDDGPLFVHPSFSPSQKFMMQHDAPLAR